MTNSKKNDIKSANKAILLEKFKALAAELPTADTGCWLWQGCIGNHGYGRLAYGSKRKGECVQETTHRLAYVAFHGEIPAGMYVLHSCHKRQCVNPEHLRLGTLQENHADMVRAKRHTWGERNPQAKLTERDVREIRGLIAQGLTSREIADRFGVCRTAVIEIKYRRNWRHVS